MNKRLLKFFLGFFAVALLLKLMLIENKTTNDMNPAHSSRKYFEAHRMREGPSASVGAIHTDSVTAPFL